MMKGPNKPSNKVIELSLYRRKTRSKSPESCKQSAEAILPNTSDRAEELAELKRQVETLKNMLLALSPGLNKFPH